jgi:hypothetical protein
MSKYKKGQELEFVQDYDGYKKGDKVKVLEDDLLGVLFTTVRGDGYCLYHRVKPVEDKKILEKHVFKKGDKVRVKLGLKIGGHYVSNGGGGNDFIEKMRLPGVLTLDESSPRGDWCLGGWSFSDDMLELAVEKEKAEEPTPKKKVSNKVRICIYSSEPLELLEVIEKYNQEDNELFFWDFISEFSCTNKDRELSATYSSDGKLTHTVTMRPSDA